jgi:hypothetical protein
MMPADDLRAQARAPGTSPSASQLLHAREGSPVVAECADVGIAPCWVCGSPSSRAQPRAAWQGANFTGQSRVRAPTSEHVCEACVWAMAGRPPDTLRMYSHLCEVGGEYLRLNKGDKPAMRAFLRRPHASAWFAAVADSGQKHVVPWAPVNPPGARGRVLFEETVVHLPGGPEGWRLLDDAAALLTAGATKAEVEAGRYEARAWQLCGARLPAFERAHGGERSGPWFSLALFLAQRDEAVVEERLAAEKTARAAKKGARRGEAQ